MTVGSCGNYRFLQDSTHGMILCVGISMGILAYTVFQSWWWAGFFCCWTRWSTRAPISLISCCYSKPHYSSGRWSQLPEPFQPGSAPISSRPLHLDCDGLFDVTDAFSPLAGFRWWWPVLCSVLFHVCGHWNVSLFNLLKLMTSCSPESCNAYLKIFEPEDKSQRRQNLTVPRDIAAWCWRIRIGSKNNALVLSKCNQTNIFARRIIKGGVPLFFAFSSPISYFWCLLRLNAMLNGSG